MSSGNSLVLAHQWVSGTLKNECHIKMWPEKVPCAISQTKTKLWLKVYKLMTSKDSSIRLEKSKNLYLFFLSSPYWYNKYITCFSSMKNFKNWRWLFRWSRLLQPSFLIKLLYNFKMPVSSESRLWRLSNLSLIKQQSK